MYLKLSTKLMKLNLNYNWISETITIKCQSVREKGTLFKAFWGPLWDTTDKKLPILNLYGVGSGLSLDSVQFSSVAQSCPTLCDPMDCTTPGFPVHHHLPELPQTHVHWVGDTIQPSHPLSSPSPPAFNHLQHQGVFQRVSSSHQVAKVLEFHLQYQNFQ